MRWRDSECVPSKPEPSHRDGERTPEDAEWFAADVLHGDEDLPLNLADLVDGAHPRVTYPRLRARFGEEAAGGLPVVAEDELEGEPRELSGEPCLSTVLIYGSKACGPVIAFRTGSGNRVSVAIAVSAACSL